MATKYLFTISELMNLINDSVAMREMEVSKREIVIAEVQNVESDKAQQLYAVLITEKESYKKIDSDYIKGTAKVMEDLNVTISGLKHHDLADQINKAEAAAQKTEDVAAEEILKSINE